MKYGKNRISSMRFFLCISDVAKYIKKILARLLLIILNQLTIILKDVHFLNTIYSCRHAYFAIGAKMETSQTREEFRLLRICNVPLYRLPSVTCDRFRRIERVQCKQLSYHGGRGVILVQLEN